MATTSVYREKGERNSNFWQGQWCTLQKKPFVKPLPYTMRYGRWTGGASGYPTDIRNFIPLANGFLEGAEGSRTASSNGALDKLYEKLEQSEALLVAWKERQSALDLMASNIGRLVRIARAVKRRDPKIVRKVMQRNPKGKDVAKTPAGLWLEYHFAIVPTIMDIHHAAGLLGFEFPVEKLSFSSGAESSRKTGNGTYQWYHNFQYKTFTKLTGEIYGLNPNIHLASMLGFGQPLSVAWEMTPFSWFVDYFVNVGQLVTNLQPRFPGVKVRNQATVILTKGRGSLGYRNREPVGQIPLKHFESVFMERRVGWPNYQLQFKSPFDLKGQQCSYIAAVLVNILSDFQRKS